ncbi:hypothetical protein ACHAXA_007137 [Cyclostephanos tholiformis]|uniref:UTP23 sensor motif region domain-containing protein n=1 Tax=Cyclostephanos tholiformis TaxID=382380 RepID=A0ABD3RRL9_9STRA
MRHGRAKASRRTLQFYRLNAPHLVRPPYRLLLDGTFLVSSIRNRVPLRERFAKLLQNVPFRCYVARSTLVELGMLSEMYDKSGGEGDGGINNDEDDDGENGGGCGIPDDERTNPFARARRYGLDECEIIETASSSSSTDVDEDYDAKKTMRKTNGSIIVHDVLSSVASRDIYQLATRGGNNSNAYFVATQDGPLSDALRAAPFVPLLRLGRAVLLLESPSSASRNHTGNVERSKLSSAGGTMTSEERRMLVAVREEDAAKRGRNMKKERIILEKRSRDAIGGSYSNRKRKRAKGPNPLSCKSGKK